MNKIQQERLLPEEVTKTEKDIKTLSSKSGYQLRKEILGYDDLPESEFKEQYLMFRKNIPDDAQEWQEQFKNKIPILKKNRITFKIQSQKYYSNDDKLFQNNSNSLKRSKIRLISQSSNNEIIQLSLELFNFSFQITILNASIESEIHSNEISNFGSYGRVYQFFHNFQRKAIKCLPIDQERTAISIEKAIRQYCFLKLFSVLEIGPKTYQSFGFDLILYKNCIEFDMEMCQKVPFDGQSYQSLEKSLLRMHQMNIVHRDIKPLNIMYSSEYKKWVFIDFGECENVELGFGFKFLMNPAGTIGYLTQQLFQIIVNNEADPKPIDPYYADAYALQKSRKNMLTKQGFLISEVKEQECKISDFYDLAIIKSAIFDNDLPKLKFIFSNRMFRRVALKYIKECVDTVYSNKTSQYIQNLVLMETSYFTRGQIIRFENFSWNIENNDDSFEKRRKKHQTNTLVHDLANLGQQLARKYPKQKLSQILICSYKFLDIKSYCLIYIEFIWKKLSDQMVQKSQVSKAFLENLEFFYEEDFSDTFTNIVDEYQFMLPITYALLSVIKIFEREQNSLLKRQVLTKIQIIGFQFRQDTQKYNQGIQKLSKQIPEQNFIERIDNLALHCLGYLNYTSFLCIESYISFLVRTVEEFERILKNKRNKIQKFIDVEELISFKQLLNQYKSDENRLKLYILPLAEYFIGKQYFFGIDMKLFNYVEVIILSVNLLVYEEAHLSAKILKIYHQIKSLPKTTAFMNIVEPILYWTSILAFIRIKNVRQAITKYQEREKIFKVDLFYKHRKYLIRKVIALYQKDNFQELKQQIKNLIFDKMSGFIEKAWILKEYISSFVNNWWKNSEIKQLFFEVEDQIIQKLQIEPELAFLNSINGLMQSDLYYNYLKFRMKQMFFYGEKFEDCYSKIQKHKKFLGKDIYYQLLASCCSDFGLFEAANKYYQKVIQIVNPEIPGNHYFYYHVGICTVQKLEVSQNQSSQQKSNIKNKAVSFLKKYYDITKKWKPIELLQKGTDGITLMLIFLQAQQFNSLSQLFILISKEVKAKSRKQYQQIFLCCVVLFQQIASQKQKLSLLQKLFNAINIRHCRYLGEVCFVFWVLIKSVKRPLQTQRTILYKIASNLNLLLLRIRRFILTQYFDIWLKIETLKNAQKQNIKDQRKRDRLSKSIFLKKSIGLISATSLNAKNHRARQIIEMKIKKVSKVMKDIEKQFLQEKQILLSGFSYHLNGKKSRNIKT